MKIPPNALTPRNVLVALVALIAAICQVVHQVNGFIP